MSWFCLPIEQGGLGILNIEDVQKIAHISAIFRLRKYRDGFVELLNSTPQVPEAMGRFVRDLHSDLRYLKDFLGLGNRNNVTMDVIMTECVTWISLVCHYAKTKSRRFRMCYITWCMQDKKRN